MTNVKTVLTGITIASLIAGGLGFTSNFKRPATTSTFYYNKHTDLTRGPIISGTQVLIQNEVKNIDNWTSEASAEDPGVSCLSSITFNHEPRDISDGIEDGQYSLQEAVNAVWDEYVRDQYDLPPAGKCITPAVTNASAIVIGRSSCP
jgi:hypothetical protein